MSAAQVPSLIVVQRDRCGICGACVPVCGSGALTLYDTYLAVDNERCTSCEKCLAVCPTHALSKVAAQAIVVMSGEGG
jgi:ferredoxin